MLHHTFQRLLPVFLSVFNALSCTQQERLQDFSLPFHSLDSYVVARETKHCPTMFHIYASNLCTTPQPNLSMTSLVFPCADANAYEVKQLQRSMPSQQHPMPTYLLPPCKSRITSTLLIWSRSQILWFTILCERGMCIALIFSFCTHMVGDHLDHNNPCNFQTRLTEY